MTSLAPVTLTGSLVRLEPLLPEHEEGLAEAARDGELWRLWYTNIPRPEDMGAEIERRLALQETGSMIPFAMRSLRDNKIIDITTYMNIDDSLPGLEIGSSWNAASASSSVAER